MNYTTVNERTGECLRIVNSPSREAALSVLYHFEEFSQYEVPWLDSDDEPFRPDAMFVNCIFSEASGRPPSEDHL